jgi:hypothetical protein
MYDSFVDWVRSVLGDSYEYSRGQWVDGPDLQDVWIAAIHHNGGPGPDVEDRRQRYRVILLGPRNGREHSVAITSHIESLVQATLGDSLPCGAASVRAIGEPVGPGYTTENRAWYSLDLQVLF